MMGCCRRNRNRSRSRSRVAALLLVVLLLLSPCSCSAELNAAALRPGPARRLLVSRPSTSRQKAEERQQQQQMRVGGESTPFKQAATSFGRKVPVSGWNPIQNR